MKKLLLPLLLLSGALLLWSADASAQTREERLAEYVYYFASDSLKGRGAGSPGAEMARYYIVARYKECGLKPFMNDDFVIPFKRNGNEYANVVGLIEGNSLKDEYIVLGAHFDHLGVADLGHTVIVKETYDEAGIADPVDVHVLRGSIGLIGDTVSQRIL